MENLEDSFLADLDNEKLDEDSGDDAEHMEEDVNGDLADIQTLNYDDLDSVSNLQKSQRYADIMKKVEDALEKGSDMSNQGIVLEEDPEYQLIVECNTLSVDIENEIVIIYRFIRDKYRLRFPELQSLAHYPINYARVVKKIGNEVDLTIVDLEGLLPSANISAISVAASTTSGKPLPQDVLQKTIEACDRALTLDASKKKVLDFVESRMGYIAPNLSAIVGSAAAAKLMVTAGGLSSLIKMPACIVQRLGAKKKALVGYIKQADVLQTTPPALRMRACHLLAGKSTLAARVDYFRGDPSGSQGRTFRDGILKKIKKWRRLRKREERSANRMHAVPDMQELANRMHAIPGMQELAKKMLSEIPEESSLGDHFRLRRCSGLGKGYGMLGQAGKGKLLVSVFQNKLAEEAAPEDATGPSTK